MRTTFFGVFVACAVGICLPVAAVACDGPLTPGVAARIMVPAVRLAQKIDDLHLSAADSDSVYLIARSGVTSAIPSLRYSHMGILYRNEAGAWQVTHRQVPCGTLKAKTYEESLGYFFMNGEGSREAGIWQLSPSVSVRLKKVLQEPPWPETEALVYSLVGHPYSHTHQNSNGWVLDLLARATSPETPKSRGALRRWLEASGYQPAHVQLGWPLFLVAWLTAYVATDDQENSGYGRVDTVSVTSVIEWLSAGDMCASGQCSTLSVE